jgi:transcriptional regulator with XRE-family HTH domain
MQLCMIYNMHHFIGENMSDDDEAIRRLFARRVQEQLNKRGWTQSELARRMAVKLPESRVGRDNVSKYVRSQVLPLPPMLQAMADVFEVTPEFLLPARHANVDIPPVQLQDQGDGTTRLRIDKVMPTKLAAKIYAMLAEAA